MLVPRERARRTDADVEVVPRLSPNERTKPAQETDPIESLASSRHVLRRREKKRGNSNAAARSDWCFFGVALLNVSYFGMDGLEPQWGTGRTPESGRRCTLSLSTKAKVTSFPNPTRPCSY